MPCSTGTMNPLIRECDPRCELHAGDLVGPRTYRDCKRRLDQLATERKATKSTAIHLNMPSRNASMAPHNPSPIVALSEALLGSSARHSLAGLSAPSESNQSLADIPGDSRPDDLALLPGDLSWSDVTMPVLGQQCLGYDDNDPLASEATNADSLENIGAVTSIDYDDGDGNITTSGLGYDDAEQEGIYTGSSPRLWTPSPTQGVVESDSEPSDFELDQPSNDAEGALASQNREPATEPSSEPQSSRDLPDGLRTIQEWIAYQSSHGNLTVSTADSLLHTINYCLKNKTLLVEGQQVQDVPVQMPSKLDTLRQHAGLTATGLRMYAVCPRVECQTLVAMSTMQSNQGYQCLGCGVSITRQVTTRRRHQKPVVQHVPLLKYTSCDIEPQLKEILGRAENKQAMMSHHEFLHRADRPSGAMEDLQHGTIWTNLTKDGEPFFSHNPRTPSRNIGFILMLDWFKPNAMQRETQSACVISLCIANLPPELRARPENKILVGVIPGPHESTVDTLHNFLEPMVDQLLVLWRKGFALEGEDFTRFGALILSACDAPAARKVGGTPGHSAMYPCTACWCPKTELHLFDNEHDPRSRAEQTKAAKVYRNLKNDNQRRNFIHARYTKTKPGGYRYSALLRLPYWDNATMTVVDPMHCLFLGLVDWQFRTIWVEMKHLREGHEIAELQKMTIMPRHCGRPPNKVGASAGGNLTSDQLRSLITIHFPLAIPVLWDTIDPLSTDQRAHEEWAKRQALKQKQKQEAKQGDKVTREATKQRHEMENRVEPTTKPPKKRRKRDEPSSEDESQPILQPDQLLESDAEKRNHFSWRRQDAYGVLLLASTIKLLCCRTVTLSQIKAGEIELKKYLAQCTEIRGAEHIQPNHHFATHIATQMRQYGPMHQFWTYSGERLNFVLKSISNNGHGGGEREYTYMTMFRLSQASYDRLTSLSLDPSDRLAAWAAEVLSARRDSRGTASSEQSDNTKGAIIVSSHLAKPVTLQTWQLDLIASHLRRLQPALQFRRAVFNAGNDPILNRTAQPLSKFTMHGGRVFSILTPGSRVVKAKIIENGEWVERVGDVAQFWQHKQSSSTADGSIITIFAQVRWYKRVPFLSTHSTWLWLDQFPHMDIDVHPVDEYLSNEVIIPACDIICHCARMEATIAGTPVWLSIGLERE